MLTRAELKERFERTFDDGLLRKLSLHIHDGYVDACERSANLDPEFKRHAIPQLRHYIIQTRIRHVAKRSRDVKAIIDISPTGTEPYTVLQAGKFFLSVSMVKSPGQLPRHSDFRQANSERNLFSTLDAAEDEHHFAIITHVPSWDNSEPVHLSVLFPNGDYSGVYDSINLNSFIDFDLKRSETPSEDITAPEPKLRKRTAKKKGG
jgi:hypothetical protein